MIDSESDSLIFSLKAKVDGTEVPEDKPLAEDEKNKELNLQKYVEMPIFLHFQA